MKIELVKMSDDSGQECYKNDKNDSKIKNLVILFDDEMHKSKRVERSDRKATQIIKTIEAKNLLIKVGNKMQFLVEKIKTVWRLYSAINSISLIKSTMQREVTLLNKSDKFVTVK